MLGKNSAAPININSTYMSCSINLNALHWEHHLLDFQSMLQLDLGKPYRWNYQTREVGSPALRICDRQIRLPEVLREDCILLLITNDQCS